MSRVWQVVDLLPLWSNVLATIEEHDTEQGALMQNVEVYVALNGGTEALLSTILPSLKNFRETKRKTRFSSCLSRNKQKR